MKRLPEEIKTAVYWLNQAGRSMVADQLAIWYERQKESPAALLPEVRDGMQLVPAEPTQEMIDAGANTINRKLDEGKQAALVYRHMLRAIGSPQPQEGN